jgi:hypothetical protein
LGRGTKGITGEVTEFNESVDEHLIRSRVIATCQAEETTLSVRETHERTGSVNKFAMNGRRSRHRVRDRVKGSHAGNVRAVQYLT